MWMPQITSSSPDESGLFLLFSLYHVHIPTHFQFDILLFRSFSLLFHPHLTPSWSHVSCQFYGYHLRRGREFTVHMYITLFSPRLFSPFHFFLFDCYGSSLTTFKHNKVTFTLSLFFFLIILWLFSFFLPEKSDSASLNIILLYLNWLADAEFTEIKLLFPLVTFIIDQYNSCRIPQKLTTTTFSMTGENNLIPNTDLPQHPQETASDVRKIRIEEKDTEKDEKKPLVLPATPRVVQEIRETEMGRGGDTSVHMRRHDDDTCDQQKTSSSSPTPDTIETPTATIINSSSKQQMIHYSCMQSMDEDGQGDWTPEIPFRDVSSCNWCCLLMLLWFDHYYHDVCWGCISHFLFPSLFHSTYCILG